MTTRTHDSIRESRVIGAEPEHEPREKQTLLKPYMRMMGGAQSKNATAAAKAVEKTPWKSRKADFSTSLGNPANNAGFPLFPQPRLLLDIPCLVDLLAPTQTDENGSVYHRR